MNAKKSSDDSVKKEENPYVYAVGKRKTSIARVKIYPKGKGEILINERKFKDYFKVDQDITSFLAPFKVAEVDEKTYDIKISVIGGGEHSQAEACRHGLARALVKEDENRRTALKKAGFLTRDSRKKERKKPGLKRARRARQWSKR